MTAMKQCSKCGKEFPATLEYFHSAPTCKDHLRADCKDCVRIYRAKYRANKSIQEREQQRRYYRENRDHVLENKRKWRAKNRKKEKTRKTTRLKRKTRLPNDFSDEDRSFAFEYFNGRCAVCGRPLNDLFGEHCGVMDHWIPVSDPSQDNPGTVPWNMVPLCNGLDGCNNKKRDRDPETFLIEDYGAKEGRKILQKIEEFFSKTKEKRANSGKQ